MSVTDTHFTQPEKSRSASGCSRPDDRVRFILDSVGYQIKICGMLFLVGLGAILHGQEEIFGQGFHDQGDFGFFRGVGEGRRKRQHGGCSCMRISLRLASSHFRRAKRFLSCSFSDCRTQSLHIVGKPGVDLYCETKNAINNSYISNSYNNYPDKVQLVQILLSFKTPTAFRSAWGVSR